MHVEGIDRGFVVTDITRWRDECADVVAVAAPNAVIEFDALGDVANKAEGFEVVARVKAVDELVMLTCAVDPGSVSRLGADGFSGHLYRLVD